MPVPETVLVSLGQALAKGILKRARRKLAEKLATTEAEKALERCGEAAVAGLVEAGLPEEAGDDLRDHLEGVLGGFTEDEEVHAVLEEALRNGRLPPEELEELGELFREEHPPDVLPGFDVDLGMAAFVDAFVRQAEEEEAFRGVIQVKELRAQTRYLEEILEEIRQQRRAQEGAAEDGRAAALRSGYLDHLFASLRKLALSGIDPALAGERKAQLDVDAVYTALATEDRWYATSAGEGEEEAVESLAALRSMVAEGNGEPLGPVSALDQVDLHERLVLLGDPGSGKSTFVTFVALCMAGELLGRDDANLELLTAPLPDEKGEDAEVGQRWSHGPLLPIRVVLRDFAATGLPPREEEGRGRHLWEFIRSQLEEGLLDDYADALKRELRNGGVLLLLDGLDEVPEARERRVQLRDVVEDFARTFPACRILVTSRVYAYQNQQWQVDGFEQATLAPFLSGQIRRFVDRWYREVAHRRGLTLDDARGKAALLERAIFESDRLRGLAERPLLLTLMASLHAWRGGSLPERRERLYAAAVELLLAHWESQRVVHDADGRPVIQQESLTEALKVGQEKLRAAIEELAFQAHGAQEDLEGTADLPEGVLIQALMRVSRDSSTNPALLLQYLRDRAGLLLPRGVGVYTFPHRMFQEYLAACRLTSRGFPEEVARLARQEPNRWREVVLLAGAKAAEGTPASAWQLARELSYRDPAEPESDPADHWGALLAGQLLVESVDTSEPSEANARQLDGLRRAMVSVMRGGVLPAIERAEAGRMLARLGDPREEVTSVDAIELCRVPAGAFLMGSREEDEGAEREKPQRTVEVPYECWVSRYPVTQAQFQVFVDEGEYGQRRFWGEAEEAEVWAEGKIRGRLESDPTPGPERYGGPFGLENHPVVGVSWYEAVAFCLWLTERWRGRGWLPRGWEVRLPREAEWEKAARGGLEVPRAFDRSRIDRARLEAEGGPGEVETEPNPEPERGWPWGDEWSADRANGNPTGIGSTSAVGCFPGGASPYGCEEMAGNVWEWCAGSMQPYGKEDETESSGRARDSSRVLRGGSYLGIPRNLRAAFRLDLHPEIRGHLFGFRLWCASSGGL